MARRPLLATPLDPELAMQGCVTRRLEMDLQNARTEKDKLRLGDKHHAEERKVKGQCKWDEKKLANMVNLKSCQGHVP
ncbi:hypothetical protein NDU88_011387 [Pleurodeles waltl]|uniref:Uncharacterized protein n=1 Tax=Pleurodeles waltl TaxID=8319 RepID=A0AAV7QYM4_PLEWA|nr:hypothetical protein NDU88_011387 [Pleurodeles waltl]